jgi:hypothetical protein
MTTVIQNETGKTADIPEDCPAYMIVSLDDVLQIPPEARNRFFNDFPAVIAALESADNNIVFWVDDGSDETTVIAGATLPTERLMEAVGRHILHYRARRAERDATSRIVYRLSMLFRSFMGLTHPKEGARKPTRTH